MPSGIPWMQEFSPNQREHETYRQANAPREGAEEMPIEPKAQHIGTSLEEKSSNSRFVKVGFEKCLPHWTQNNIWRRFLGPPVPGVGGAPTSGEKVLTEYLFDCKTSAKRTRQCSNHCVLVHKTYHNIQTVCSARDSVLIKPHFEVQGARDLSRHVKKLNEMCLAQLKQLLPLKI